MANVRRNIEQLSAEQLKELEADWRGGLLSPAVIAAKYRLHRDALSRFTLGSSMKMPFGQHKGQDLQELPARYLEWIVSDVSPAEFPELVMAAKKELEFRDPRRADMAVTVSTRRHP